MSEAKFIRIIVFFNLLAKRKATNQFRQFLLKDGYQMLQLSVYSRIIKGQDSLQKHYNRLCANLPQEGSIRCLEVTEKQYATMKLLLGELKTQEKRVNSDQLLLF
ncbi:CRISPR-associated endonuclease Cas2 [Neisseria sp. P0004.S004]|jgi:CRISPR-associated endoribonuclease cas2|uniref:CRISPR-associated endonuclease Cas2 n=1 Tax=Neisseria TaxID=482 RepID=UPI00066E70BE|nr:MULTISPECIES: CRISPR-associated endonuclease Cas2 [Neisseria]MCL9791929.1 CRISPR-associated endonuclease Cas2 [Neisseria subflava]OHP48945.1 CRISPR-associated endonuclease Cas2 [Neisseria sp. HMSC061B04]